MGPTPESAGITAEPVFFWMNLKSELCPRKPDSSEIHSTPGRDWYLSTGQI